MNQHVLLQFTILKEDTMKSLTTKPTAVVRRWTFCLAAMLTLALMVPAAAYSTAGPTAPVLATPADLATNQPQAPTLIWNAATGVGTITYHLQVATDVGFSSLVADNAGLTATSQLITGLALNTPYYWRVLASDDGGPGSYSTPFSFTTWASIPSPGPLPVTLGKTAMFAILSYAGITDVPTSAVTGDVGASPIAGSAIGLTQTEVTGTIYTVDATGPAGSVVAPSLLTSAMGDLTIAYGDAEGRTVDPIGLAGNIGGQTLYPGLYKSTGSLEITSGDLTLDGNGDATSVWIFQIASFFNMTSGRQVLLTNGAKASNVFWQVGSAATLGTTCVMKGTIMAATTVTLATGATLEGRALAKTADVTLQSNAITNPGTINLKSAATFGVLSGAGISGTGTVSGNVGTSTGTIDAGITATGTKYAVGDAAVTTAHSDLLAAYNDAAGRTADAVLSATTFELGSTTQTPGIYKIGTDATMTGTLTLDGPGIYIFQIGGDLTTATSSIVSLTNGAQWSDVFWQVGGSATLGTNSAFEGTILADASIQVNTGATLTARLLAAAVTASGTVALNGNNVLPVEMVSFTASTSGLNAQLHWSTATEVNNYGFEIQRRSAESESIGQWLKVGFVPGVGSSSSPHQYSYADQGLAQGRYDYRIKQIDKNGSFKYSSAAQVEVGIAPKEFTLSQSYPNPFNPSTTVEFSVARNDRAVVRVFNVLGQEVATLFDGTAEAGKLYQARFDASRMSSGMYFVQLQSNGQSKMQKMVFLK
jgi:hypothetical protein